jgi:hypothetical protein
LFIASTTSTGARSGLSAATLENNVLMDLERLSDARIVPFLQHVPADQREPTEVRIHVLKQLRNGRLPPAYWQLVAEVIPQILPDHSSPDLRLQAVRAIAEFTDIDGVPAVPGGQALDPDETIDVRYSAFTSLQRAGPTPECVVLLRQLSADEALDPSARSACGHGTSNESPAPVAISPHRVQSRTRCRRYILVYPPLIELRSQSADEILAATAHELRLTAEPHQGLGHQLAPDRRRLG